MSSWPAYPADRDPRPATAPEAIVRALLEAIEEPLAGDRGHVFRVQAYSGLLARQLCQAGPYAAAIDQQFLADLQRASPLHDVGKLAIDPQILGKPGRLTTAEFDAVKQHVRVGARLLRRAAEFSPQAPWLHMAAEIALYHHERFDGSGYCAGLAGEAIPLAARIVALADVYDALTSARAYKSALPHDQAAAAIAAEAGRHFDPALVMAFQQSASQFQQLAAADRRTSRAG